ncbi:MAG TPA: DUF4287 domain-containing protein [Pyrinomonadaceae bacterium]|nr:DUF4287 domain-containing protein [Pyrinomonadaceae bacterium]
MSDDAVQAKTGKTWDQWFSLLDKAGAKKMNHQEIVKLLNSKFDVGPWWQQMVTVTYEQARGLRDVHQKPAGYEISVSRTVNAPVAKLYKAFAQDKERKAWLSDDGLTVSKATAGKSLRGSWNGGKANLAVAFYPKGDNKAQVVVQQSKIVDAKSSAKMKTYWGAALDRLQQALEK